MIWLFSNPFWPSVMAAVTTAAAFFFGIADARQVTNGYPTGEWLRRSVALYGVPFLFIGFVALCFLFSFYVDSLFAGLRHCADAACKQALGEAEHLLFLGELAILQACVLAAMALTLYIRKRINAPMAQKQGIPDPRKWHYDRATGEYHRVSKFYKGHVLLSPKTYNDRMKDDLLASGRFWGSVKALSYSFIVGSLSLVFGSWTYNAHDSAINMRWQTFVGFGLAGLCGLIFFFAAITVIVGLFGRLRDNVGPRPVAPPGREEVERQKVFGDGGFATRAQIDAAARGAAGNANQQEFYD